jgi:hypothetical protein
MKKALKDGNFEWMQRLFRLRFEWDGYRQAKKTYRKLSLKFHPDKNKACDAKLAFQALGEVYGYIV